MGVYDSITGFMSGYSDTEGNTGEKIFAGVKEGLAKVVTNLIGLPLDLLKKGLTYLITFFFGESVVTKSLEAFSFADTIGKMESIGAALGCMFAPQTCGPKAGEIKND